MLDGNSSGSPVTDQLLRIDVTAIADATERAVDKIFTDFPPASQGIAVQH